MGRGPSAGTAARRQEILRAARDSFLEHGVEGASLRDIAARAGMTHAGLLHHYRSKDELVVALLQQRDAEERETSDRGAGSAADRGALAVLTQLLVERQAQPELVRLWLEVTAAAARPAHPAHRYFPERYASIRASTADWLRARAAAGMVRDDVDPEHLAALLAAVLDGLQLQWLHDHDLPVVEIVAHFLELTVTRPGEGADSPAQRQTAPTPPNSAA